MSQAPYGPGPAAPAPWPPQGPPPGPGAPSRIPTIVAIVLAVIAIAVGLGAWFKPAPKPEAPAAKTYSEQEVADAKKALCEAFQRTERALNTNSQRAGNTPTDDRTVIANSRIAIDAAGSYLAFVVADEQAAPSELATSVRKLSGAYQKMVLDQIGDVDAAQLNSDYQDADALVSEVSQSCG